MLKPTYLLLAGAVSLSLCLSSCIDSDYDLSDIDTTVEVKVNDLTVPVNLDEVYLKSILKPDDDSCIKEVNGEYALLKSGSINSDPVIIDRQLVVAPSVKPTVRDIEQSQTPPDGIEPSEEVQSYDMVDIMGDFSYDKNDIPQEILSLRKIGVDWTLSITVSVSDPDNIFRSVEFRNVIISFPKGLITDDTKYDPATGDYNLGNVSVPQGQRFYTLALPVKGVDLAGWTETDFNFVPGSGDTKGKVHIEGHVGVKSGDAVITIMLGSGKPQTVRLTMSPVLSDILVKSFSGRVQYTFSDFNIPAIDINDLPDVLADETTSVILENPQLYVALTNPVAKYGLSAETGLELTPMRGTVASPVVSLDPGQSIQVGCDKGVYGPYLYCISPSRPDIYYQGFEGAAHVACAGLSGLLAGDGVPSSIAVDLPGARVLPGDVDDFELGVSEGEITGDYTIYCPLDFGPGSKIVYSDTIDGWNDDSVDRIVISSLTLATDITNNLPFDVVLSGYPMSLDNNGEPVRSIDPATGKEVSISEVTIPAGETSPVKLTTDGTVTHLDGIHFVARAIVTSDNEVLAPDTAIRLANIKVTVSGSYTDTL